MDSRIREIEQWVAEARDDLGECGREAYLHKLYLLDAEIRAVIKENGVHPQDVSPRSGGQRVRRVAPLSSGLGVAAVLLAASTVYLGVRGPQSMNPTILTVRPAAPSRAGLAGPSSIASLDAADVSFLASHGEELVPDGWEPPATEAELPAVASEPAAGPVILASNTGTRADSLAPGPIPGHGVELLMASRPAKPAGQTTIDLNEATEVAVPDAGFQPGGPEIIALSKTPHQPSMKAGSNYIGSATVDEIRTAIEGASGGSAEGAEPTRLKLDVELLTAAGEASLKR